jgi:F0F1-type ATP synthase membrane subunit c/vacuolar-type H+-ATPase subunit K
VVALVVGLGVLGALVAVVIVVAALRRAARDPAAPP